MSKMGKVIPLFFILLGIFFLYKQVIGFDYVWDDDSLLVDNIDLINSALTWDIISRPVLQETSYFRPLVFLSWFGEFNLLGQSAYISHSINLILFLINIGLVYSLAYVLAKTQHKTQPILLASVCAVLYAIHPIQVETTAWVSGRFDLMATLFGLLACIVFVHQQQKAKSSLLFNMVIASLVFLALMSKELGLVIPVILFSLYMATSSGSFSQSFKAFFKQHYALVILIGISFAIYYVLRVQAMHGAYHYPITWEYYQTFVIGHQVPLYALKQYLIQAFLPFFHLGPVQPTYVFIQPTLMNILSIVLVALALIGLIVYAIKKSFFAWLMLAYLVSISLVIYLVPLSIADNLLQERFMTFGISFFLIAVVFAVDGLKQQLIKKTLTALIGVWIIAALMTTKSILPFWKNEIALWEWMHKTHPEVHVVTNLYYSSLLKYNYPQALIQSVNKDFIEKNKNLHTSHQILYAKALLMTKDPESLNYLRGVHFVLPKFHTLAANASADELHHLSTRYGLMGQQVASLYDSLSIATLWYENNPQLALEYNYAAERYLPESEKLPVLYNRLALFKILNQHVEAQQLDGFLSKMQMYRKDENTTNLNTIVAVWCEKNHPPLNCR